MTGAGVLVAIGAVLFGAIGVVVFGGCAVQPEPSEEAVLYYLRAAQVNGQVRRAWPEGQTYVDRVLELDAQLKEEIDELERFRVPEELWLREDPRWRDEGAVTKRMEELREILEGRRPTRDALLRELDGVIREVPSPLSQDVDADAFTEKVWGALSPQGPALGKPVRAAIVELQERVADHLELCRSVLDCAEFLDPHSTGLAMADEECRERVESQYAALLTDLDGERENFVLHAEKELRRIGAELEAPDARADKHEHQYLRDLQKYLRDELTALPKDLFEATRQAERELAEAREKMQADASGDAERQRELAAEAAFLELKLERLEGERARVRTRVDAILTTDAGVGAQ